MNTDLARYLAEAHASGLTLSEAAAALEQAGWTAQLVASEVRGALAVPTPSSTAAADSSVIRVEGLAKRYGTFTAVDGISFEVRRGEVFGILGPNGAGKTTTLEMIEGLRVPTQGTAVINGIDVVQRPLDVKAIIGVQPQASSFFEGLTLRETLELFGALYDRSVDAMALLAEVQLTEKAHAQVTELSGGQKQRFSIAVGLVNEPVVLFLDEPTTGLDPQARRNLWDLVRQINARGTTVVLTTHYMDEAEALCDRIAVMDHARIVALDTTERLLIDHGGDAAIEFSAQHPVHADTLLALSGVTNVISDGLQYTLRTAHPKQTLDQLFEAGRMHGFSIDGLAFKRATLEDVFIKLTGHALRD
jgi:ABC-2 type transport system ATP-binding protein